MVGERYPWPFADLAAIGLRARVCPDWRCGSGGGYVRRKNRAEEVGKVGGVAEEVVARHGVYDGRRKGCNDAVEGLCRESIIIFELQGRVVLHDGVGQGSEV